MQQMLTIWEFGNNLIFKKYSLTQRRNKKHAFKLKKKNESSLYQNLRNGENVLSMTFSYSLLRKHKGT